MAGEEIRKASWSYVIIGVINIILSILNAIGVALSLKAINYVIVFILPFLAIEVSLDAISNIIPKLSFFLRNFLSPFIGWTISIILLLSGIGIILRKSWGRTFAYIYAMGIIAISVIGFPIVLIGYIREFIRISRGPSFMDGIIWGGALAYILTLIGTLVYPAILLLFFRPKIKERFRSKG